MAETLNEEMVATYEVEIVGIKRTRAELARLDGIISQLRAVPYANPSIRVGSPGGGTAMVGAQIGSGDIFVTSLDRLEGRVQGATRDAMAKAMALGRRTQAEALRAAETKTGRSGKPKGRRGPGREVTGEMIRKIATNVETYQYGTGTRVNGWHGWSTIDRSSHISFQEKGTKGRGGASRDEANKAGGIYRTKNRKGKRTAGARGQQGHPGVPAANSLGASIVVVREFLIKELAGLRA